MEEIIDNSIDLFLDIKKYKLLEEYDWNINNNMIVKTCKNESEGIVTLYLNSKLLTYDNILELEDIFDLPIVVTHNYIGTSKTIRHLGLC